MNKQGNLESQLERAENRIASLERQVELMEEGAAADTKRYVQQMRQIESLKGILLECAITLQNNGSSQHEQQLVKRITALLDRGEHIISPSTALTVWVQADDDLFQWVDDNLHNQFHTCINNVQLIHHADNQRADLEILDPTVVLGVMESEVWAPDKDDEVGQRFLKFAQAHKAFKYIVLESAAYSIDGEGEAEQPAAEPFKVDDYVRVIWHQNEAHRGKIGTVDSIEQVDEDTVYRVRFGVNEVLPFIADELEPAKFEDGE